MIKVILMLVLGVSIYAADGRAKTKRLERIQDLFKRLREMNPDKPKTEEKAEVKPVSAEVTVDMSDDSGLSKDELSRIESMIDKEIEKVELGANEVENAVPVDEVSPFNLDVKKKPSTTPVIPETIEPVVTESDDLEYVVQPGDSLLLIARKILLDPKKYKDIVKWNDLKSEVLYPNQKLILKGVSAAKKSEFKRLNTDDRSLLYSPDEYYYMIYKVQSGDSLSRIAKKLLGSHNEYFKLAKFNGLNPDKFLYIGQKLVIPIKK